MKKTISLLSMLLVSSLAFAAFPVASTEIIQATDPETSFHFGGFLLGFFLGVYGVIIAYLIGEKNVIRSAWWGFGIIILIAIALAITLVAYGANNGGYYY
jgi:hypothetical protein